MQGILLMLKLYRRRSRRRGMGSSTWYRCNARDCLVILMTQVTADVGSVSYIQTRRTWVGIGGKYGQPFSTIVVFPSKITSTICGGSETIRSRGISFVGG